MNGYELWRGESLLDGSPLVVLGTGYEIGSKNAKTGEMIQTWILRADMPPVEALRSGADSSICGDCPLRGDGMGRERGCYVNVHWAPTQVWRAWALGRYGDLRDDYRTLRNIHAGRSVRLGSYGDPAAVPFELWEAITDLARNHTGYTHAWLTCDERLRTLCMASVDSLSELREAHRRGWRTFRIVREEGALLSTNRPDREILCPASKEAGHRTTCERCGLCRGAGEEANIAIVAHGTGRRYAFAVATEEERERRAA